MPETKRAARRRPNSPRSRAFRSLQLAVIRSNYGRARVLWVASYNLFARLLAAYLRRGVTAGVYLKGSFGRGEPVFGLSDIGLVVIVAEPGGDKELVERRWRALTRKAPPVTWIINNIPVYSQAEVPELASTCFAYGLRDREPRSLFFPPGRSIRLATLPGLWPTQDWRLVSGTDLRPRINAADPEQRRLGAWLDLQSWWRLAFRAAAAPEAHWSPYLCLKLVAEPARILLWLDGEQHLRRDGILRRSLDAFPEERPTIEYVLGLGRQLHRVRTAPLATVLPCLVRLSTCIAERLTVELAPLGAVEVQLHGADLTPAALTSSGAALPLCDWRALVRPTRQQESFQIAPGRVDDPVALHRAAQGARDGRHLTLMHDGLMFRPGGERSTALRAIAFGASDPVSTALVAGCSTAAFPNVRGWSAIDTAVRAVAEHRAWLRTRSPLPDGAEDAQRRRLGGCFSAARAALFHEALSAGEPSLQVTFAAVAQALAERMPGSRALVEDAYGWYGATRPDGKRASAATVNAIASVVGQFGLYRGAG